jgi:hypothetical protein
MEEAEDAAVEAKVAGWDSMPERKWAHLRKTT